MISVHKVNDEEDTQENAPLQSNWIQTIHRFELMDLKPPLLKSVLREFKKPLKIQYKAITPCCLGRDTIITAPENAGKTSTAVISILNTINYAIKACQAVILVHDITKAEKVKTLISALCPERKKLHCCIYDPNDQTTDDLKCFTEGVQIIIGTPKSLLALFSADTYVKIYKIHSVVLDEAELLLSPEHIQCVNHLLYQYIDWTSQLILLSTQISKEILKFANERMADPIKIIVNTEKELEIFEEESKSSEIAEKCTDDIPPIITDIAMEVDLKNTSIIKETSSHRNIEQFHAAQDEFDLLGKLIALKLRNLPADERVHIGQILNSVLFDTIPRNCNINEVLANILPDSRKNRGTQTDNNGFYIGEFHSSKDKLIMEPMSSQLTFSNVTQITNVKWIRHFEDAPLKRQIKSGILYDFKIPLLLQQKSLKLLLNGYDVLIQSPKDSGKTTAVIIAALNVIDVQKNECQAVIVVPNLDLVYKTQENVNNLSQYIPNFKCRPVSNHIELKHYVNSRAHIVITVPEFVTTMMDEKFFYKNYLRLFAVEQIDEIFQELSNKLIHQLMNQLPAKVQIILTRSQLENLMPIHLLSRHLLQITATPEDLLLNGVKQFYVYIRNEERRYNVLCETLKKLKDLYPTVVFCNTIHEVLELSTRLSADGNVTAVSLIEKLDQKGFEEFIHKFFAKSKRVLISSDYCANNIDIECVPVVISFIMPFRKEHFIERIRRSGRHKHKNHVISFVTDEDKPMLKEIQQTYGITINEIVNWMDVDFSSSRPIK